MLCLIRKCNSLAATDVVSTYYTRVSIFAPSKPSQAAHCEKPRKKAWTSVAADSESSDRRTRHSCRSR